MTDDEEQIDISKIDLPEGIGKSTLNKQDLIDLREIKELEKLADLRKGLPKAQGSG